MSQEDIQVVRDIFRATNERDFGRALSLYAEDVVLVVNEGFLNTGTFEGKEAVGEWFGDWFRAFGREFHFEITEARDLGGGVVLITASYGGTGRASGAEVRDRRSYLYRVRGGLITRVQFFMTTEDALEAASLPEWSDPETH